MSIGPATRAELGPGRARCGAYYRLPRPEGAGLAWESVTCHDLGHGPRAGHVALWPTVVRRLAATWGLDPDSLARRLTDHYAGLPRGRVARVRGLYLHHHGSDAPALEGLALAEGRFGLSGRSVRRLFDEHERMLADDCGAVQEALARDLGLRGV